MKINADISILHNNGIVEITIRDRDSNTRFVELHLSPEQFCTAALGRLMNTECDGEVYNLDHVGKKHENKTLEFEIPEDIRRGNNKEALKELSIKTCPKGWEPDFYFGSQNSFFRKDDKNYARCTIRRWIEK